MTPAEFRTAREALGATQAELAVMIGIGRRTVNRLENAATIPDRYALAMDALIAAHKELLK